METAEVAIHLVPTSAVISNQCVAVPGDGSVQVSVELGTTATLVKGPVDAVIEVSIE